jgi:hypothetical protein
MSRQYLLSIALSSLFVLATAATAAEKVPKGVDILLPRGGIPAVFEPIFVSADEAEITPDAWVFGVVVEEVPRAYSLNLLNSHEIVNDRIGDTAFAAVW